jgi:hypothetical protein
MAVANGYGKIATSGSVFAFDVGDTVNSYKGIPKTNLLSYFSRTYGETNNVDFKTHYYTTTVNVPSVGTVSVENIDTYNTGANVCCEQCWYFGSTAATGNTVYTYSIIYRSSSNYTHPNFMYKYEYGASGYITEGGLHSDSNRTHLGNGWYHAWGTFTTNANTTSLNCYFYMYEYNVYNTISVAGVMLVQGNVIIPPKQFLGFGSSRSNTTGLLPTIGNQSLDLSNTSFDTLGSITFDGINDYISAGDGFDSTAGSLFATTGVSWSVSCIFKFPISPATTRSTGNTAWVMLGRSGGIGGAETFSLFVGGNGNTTYGDFSYKLAIGIRGTKTQISPSTVNTGTWNHVVVTWDGTTGYSYFNGNLMGTLNIGTVGVQTGQLFTIGSTGNTGAGANTLMTYEGDIAVAQVHNRVLTLGEVKQNYNHYKTRFNLS